MFAGLLLWPRFERTALSKLAYTRVSLWRVRMAKCVVRISNVSAFLQQFQRVVRITRRGDDPLGLAHVAGLGYLIGGEINAEIERAGEAP